MKITSNSLIEIVKSDGYINHHISEISKAKLTDSILKRDVYEKKILFFKDAKFRNLILSSNVLSDIENNYVVPKDIRYNVLRSLPNKKDCILVDEKTVMRYHKTENEIQCCFDISANDLLYNHMFSIDLINERTVMHVKEKASDPLTKDMSDNFMEKIYGRFMLIVTYLELTDIETIVLEGGKKYGTRKSGKFINKTNKNYILVTSDWNIEKIDLRDIHVRGHYRLQPYGVGRSQYRYVYIKPYEKGITRRLAQKELVN